MERVAKEITEDAADNSVRSPQQFKFKTKKTKTAYKTVLLEKSLTFTFKT